MTNKEDLYVCEVCNKSFSGVKAVCGHVGVHKPEKQTRRQSSNGGFHADDSTCKLCGRVFRSMKALFGHMRCHPERDWRGLNPPSAQHGLHICWKQIKMEVDDDLLSAAIDGLLMLARCGEKDKEEKDEYVDDGSIGYELSDKKNAVKEKRKRETLEAVNNSTLYRSLGGHKRHNSDRGDDKEGRDKLEVLEATLGLHRCSVCYKTCPTGQAPGGHMRCHQVVSSSTLGSTSASAEVDPSGRRVTD